MPVPWSPGIAEDIIAGRRGLSSTELDAVRKGIYAEIPGTVFTRAYLSDRGRYESVVRDPRYHPGADNPAHVADALRFFDTTPTQAETSFAAQYGTRGESQERAFAAVLSGAAPSHLGGVPIWDIYSGGISPVQLGIAPQDLPQLPPAQSAPPPPPVGANQASLPVVDDGSRFGRADSIQAGTVRGGGSGGIQYGAEAASPQAPAASGAPWLLLAGLVVLVLVLRRR